jgi:hypothetical protein
MDTLCIQEGNEMVGSMTKIKTMKGMKSYAKRVDAMNPKQREAWLKKNVTIHKFKTESQAHDKARFINERYGMGQSVFKVTTPKGKVFYSVVQPKGLKKVN